MRARFLVPGGIAIAAVAVAGLLVGTPAALAGSALAGSAHRGDPVASAAPRWQDESPVPGPGVFSSLLGAVSCTGPRTCLTVGNLGSQAWSGVFSRTWNGLRWTTPVAPLPHGDNIVTVSCATASACTAVGSVPKGPRNLTLAERWNGSHWTVQNTPSPVGAEVSSLVSVSCPTTTSCTAVGQSADRFGLAEHWNGRKWRIQSTPSPAGENNAALNDVSCSSARSCVAVGTFIRSASYFGMYSEIWNGRRWTAQVIAEPEGDKTGGLGSVSCSSPTACTAVGSQGGGGISFGPLIERWNGKTWRQQLPDVPSGWSARARAIFLDSVSCAAARACTAIGGDGFANGLVAETWNGIRWRAQVIHAPSGSRDATLPSVSCSAPARCMAVGDFSTRAGTEFMLAEHYS
jgi:hypothetical protein